MVSPVRKRIFIILALISVVIVLMRCIWQRDGNENTIVSFQHIPGTPVLVMVYYEALCPDSKHFIVKQLLPAYQAASGIMDIIYVPYGKSTTSENSDGSYSFDCQHGPAECLANTYHACAVEAIEDNQTRLNMIVCMIKDNRQPKEAMYKCAKQLSLVTTDLIQKCVDSSHGAELLKLNGEATHALRPRVTFIPTVTLDGSQGRQPAILKNLLAEICKLAHDESVCKNA